MTLPFRRRHHDDEAPHDRARALISAGLDGPLAPADEGWLADHLARCHECSVDARAYRDDRALLRALRDRSPVPPRDLWARTSAAIEQEARRSAGGTGPVAARLAGLVPARQRLPLGVLSGALVVLVVVAVALVPTGAPAPGATAAGSNVAQLSLPAGPTQIPIADAAGVTWIVRAADGSYAIVSAPVDEACPAADPTCAPLAPGSPTPIELGAEPQAVVLSPQSDQVAVVGSAGATAGSVIIVAVPTPRPSGATSSPVSSTGLPATPTAPTPPPTATPFRSLAPTTQPPSSPTSSPTSSPNPSPSAPAGSEPPGTAGHAIITGVQVVGDTAYSASGQWLAFSAKPLDSDAGPYLYAWHVGDDQARQLTLLGSETYFAGWFGDQIVASEVVRAEVDGPNGTPAMVGLPRSFLLDPSTGVRQAFQASDAWLPSIDPHGRFVTYWSGQLQPVFAPSGASPSGEPPSAAPGSPSPAPAGSPAASPVQPIVGWQLGHGQLVLDGWSDALTGVASPAPSAASSDAASASLPASSHGNGRPSPGRSSSEEPSLAPGSTAPSPSPTLLAAGPAGTVVPLATGSVSAFETRFDPDGTRLAIWVADGSDPTVGRLWLVILDPDAGAIRLDAQPLPAPGVTALHGFSLLRGRLGWVTPPGQDGEPSSVHVLAWNGDAFGQIQTVPGGNPQIVR